MASEPWGRSVLRAQDWYHYHGRSTKEPPVRNHPAGLPTSHPLQSIIHQVSLLKLFTDNKNKKFWTASLNQLLTVHILVRKVLKFAIKCKSLTIWVVPINTTLWMTYNTNLSFNLFLNCLLNFQCFIGTQNGIFLKLCEIFFNKSVQQWNNFNTEITNKGIKQNTSPNRN